jgi:putative sterol carrier protein
MLIERGNPVDPDAVVESDTATLTDVIKGRTSFSAALRGKSLRVEGDAGAVRRVLTGH